MILSHSTATEKIFRFTISASAATVNLRTSLLAANWNGNDKAVATIGAGVLLTGTAATPALTVSGAFPHGVELVISSGASVLGIGGAGGLKKLGYGFANAGSQGGPALLATTPITITNLGAIAGGGGGGGGGGGANGSNDAALGSGVGGDGAGNGAAATAGTAGATGTGGTYAGNGGTGGAVGSAGANGTNGYSWVNGLGYFAVDGGAGGTPGNAVTGNSNITWQATGTRTGPIA